MCVCMLSVGTCMAIEAIVCGHWIVLIKRVTALTACWLLSMHPPASVLSKIPTRSMPLRGGTGQKDSRV